MEILHTIKSVKEKILEADPNSERSLTIHQGIEKVPAPHHKLHDEKKASTV